MADSVLELGEVEIPDWSSEMSMRNYIAFRESEKNYGPRIAFMLHDIAFVRTWVRKQRYGEGDGPTVTYRAQVKWAKTGEAAVWEFDHTVGWPVEDGKRRDWRAEWKKYHGGAA